MSEAGRCASSTRSTTSGCCSSPATASRPSTSSCRPRSPTRAACSPASRLLVRAHARDRPEPPARAARRRPLDRVPPARDAADRVRRARLPRRLGLEGLPGDRRRLRPRAPGGAAASRTGCPSRSSRPRRRRRGPRREHRRATQAAELVGAERFGEVERASLELYRFASEHAAERGIIIADTKFEFGLDADGGSCSPTRRFTPDSSRFWPADEYAPGGPQPSFDKQFVRDYCESLGWDKTLPRPGAAGRRRRRHAGPLRRGVRAADRDLVRRLPRRPRGRAPVKATVLVRPKPGILDPQGEAVASSLRHLGFAVDEARVGRVVDLELEAADADEARAEVERMCEQLLANPLIESLRDLVTDGERPAAPEDRGRRRSPARTTTATPRSRSSASAPRRARLARRAPSCPTSTRSCCPAASRTATTCAAARSPGSRR